MYTSGVGETGVHWGRLSEFRVDEVAAQNGISQKRAEDDGIPDGSRVDLRDELRSINKRQ